MSEEFYIPLGGKTVPILLTPLCRRSYMYKIGQLYFVNRFNQAALMAVFCVLLYNGYTEYCKANGIEATLTEKYIAELVDTYGNEPATIEVLTKIGRRYAELEEQEPTVITEIFAP
jgi:hypothetical protein